MSSNGGHSAVNETDQTLQSGTDHPVGRTVNAQIKHKVLDCAIKKN